MNGPERRSDLRRTLRAALGVMLPTTAETRLLRAILYSGEQGRQAWRDWRRSADNPPTAFEGERTGQKSLLPLLHAAVVRNAVEVEATLASWLRAGYFREELRGHAYRRIVRETLAALSGEAGPPIVLKGCALSDTVYDDPNARHSHGIELLLSETDLDRVAGRLREMRFTPITSGTGLRSGHRSWVHPAGLPLVLRTRLFDACDSGPSVDMLRTRARSLPGMAAFVLGPEDALLHVCGSAARSGSRGTLRWACDAWLLIKSHRSFDWTLFVAIAEAARLALPLSVLVRYLAEALQAPVPVEALAALDALADETTDASHEAAVLGALVGTHSRMRRLIADSPDWPARFILLRCLLAPSAACVREMGHASGPWRLPVFYLLRPMLYAGRRLLRIGARSRLTLSRGAELR